MSHRSLKRGVRAFLLVTLVGIITAGCVLPVPVPVGGGGYRRGGHGHGHGHGHRHGHYGHHRRGW